MDYYNQSNCSESDGLSSHQRNSILIVMGGTSSVSLLMCIIAITMVLWLKLYKIFTYRLALYEVSSSLAMTISLILNLMFINYDGTELYYKVVCRADAVILQYTTSVKLLFTMCLNFHLFCLAVFFRNFKRLEAVLLIVCCILPIFMACIPFINGLYGMAGAWCWIKGSSGCSAVNVGFLEQIALWYGPLLLSVSISLIGSIIVMVVLTYRLYCDRHRSTLEGELLLKVNEKKNILEKAMKDLLPLLIYPVVFYLLTFFPLANRIYSSTSSHVSFWWTFATALSISLWGFFSATSLLLHIFLTRQSLTNRKCTTRDEQSPTQPRSVPYYTVSSVGYTSRPYIPPSESSIDNLLN